MIVFSTRAKVILRACFAVLFALMVVLPVAVIVVNPR